MKELIFKASVQLGSPNVGDVFFTFSTEARRLRRKLTSNLELLNQGRRLLLV